MTKTRLLLASPELVIKDPATGLRVPAEGILVDARATFWLRRLKQGSMVVAAVAAESKPRHLLTPAAGLVEGLIAVTF